MHRAVFVAACKIAERLDVFIEIGGGEPTLHSLLWDFLGIALRYKHANYICIVTNGKLTGSALTLARLGEGNVIRTRLSQDKFHDKIDAFVVKTFSESWSMNVGIRDVTDDGLVAPAPFGRAKEWATDKDLRCPGNDLHIAPNGIIYACGCKSVTYGTVFEPQLPSPLPKQEWCPDKLGFYDD